MKEFQINIDDGACGPHVPIETHDERLSAIGFCLLYCRKVSLFKGIYFLRSCCGPDIWRSSVPAASRTLLFNVRDFRRTDFADQHVRVAIGDFEISYNIKSN